YRNIWNRSTAAAASAPRQPETRRVSGPRAVAGRVALVEHDPPDARHFLSPDRHEIGELLAGWIVHRPPAQGERCGIEDLGSGGFPGEGRRLLLVEALPVGGDRRLGGKGRGPGEEDGCLREVRRKRGEVAIGHRPRDAALGREDLLAQRRDILRR